MVELKPKEVEKEEGCVPLPEGTCPNCEGNMTKLGKKFRCFKCGIEVEDG